MATNTDTSETTPIPAVEDSRETCFQQGKPCIYAAPEGAGPLRGRGAALGVPPPRRFQLAGCATSSIQTRT